MTAPENFSCAGLCPSIEGREYARGVVWDLSDLYEGCDDPLIEEDLQKACQHAIAFEGRYRKKITEDAIDATTLLQAFKEYESIHDTAMKPYLFAFLCHVSDTADHRRAEVFQRVLETWNGISRIILFFPVQLKALSTPVLNELASKEELRDYSYCLRKMVMWKPHILSEPEEQIMEDKVLTGRQALISLFTELTGSFSFPVEIEGRTVEVTGAEVLALLNSSRDAQIREKAYSVFLKRYGEHGTVFKHIINTVVLDRIMDDQRRKHPSPMHRAILLNGVDEASVETMMSVTEENYHLAGEYFRLKARNLGLLKLKNTDIFAPMADDEVERIPFAQARGLIVDSLIDLHPLLGETAEMFFRNGWIDAEIRKGKPSGAFCFALSPAIHPFISLNYTGSLRDVMTLSHEIGHGIHYILSSEVGFLNFTPPPVLAETASLLSEMALAHHLLKKDEFKRYHPSILSRRIETMIITVFRQNLLTRFEQALYCLRRCGPMSLDDICRLWMDENYKLYGEDVDMIPEYRWGWAYVPHLIHFRFYCFSYVFGGLLSMIIFEKFLKEGQGIMDKVAGILRSGGGCSPFSLPAAIGMDPHERSSWASGFDCFAGMIRMLKGFVDQVSERREE